jgi:hypothetical protein
MDSSHAIAAVGTNLLPAYRAAWAAVTRMDGEEGSTFIFPKSCRAILIYFTYVVVCLLTVGQPKMGSKMGLKRHFFSTIVERVPKNIQLIPSH